MEIFGIIFLFGFLLGAFWVLIFLAITVKGWVMLGARELFVKKWGHKLGMERNYAQEGEE